MNDWRVIPNRHFLTAKDANAWIKHMREKEPYLEYRLARKRNAHGLYMVEIRVP